jgi:hypothetical protein
MVNWVAVLYGIGTALVIGLLSGLGLPFTDATLPTIGAGLTGLVAGAVAGYSTHEGGASGAVHGFLATSVGGLIVALLLVVLGTLVAGFLGLSVALAVLALVVVYGVPGAIGGALGGIVASEKVPAGQPTT